MKSCSLFMLLLALVAFSIRAQAQDVLTVDEQTLAQHVDHRVVPVYAAIAKAVQVQGTVVIEIKVGVTGKVESTKVVSGHPMLQSAAIDCVKQWTFHPFEKDGAPVSASGRVSIVFSLGKDGPTPKEEEIASRYFSLSDQCRTAANARKDYAMAADLCKQAADTADEFPADRRFIEKRSSFVWAASALMNNKELNPALVYASKAVEMVKLGHDDNSGSNAAFGIKGMVEANLGDLKAADQDLTIAEDFERKGIEWAEQVKFEHGDSYKHALVQDLRFHAQVLQGLNRPDEAQKKLDEAAKYN